METHVSHLENTGMIVCFLIFQASVTVDFIIHLFFAHGKLAELARSEK